MVALLEQRNRRNLAQPDDVAAPPRANDGVMNRVARFVMVPVAFMALAACSGAGSVASESTVTESATTTASAGPVSTREAIASSGSNGGLRISSLLGAPAEVSPSTTWTRITDTASPFTYDVPSTWTVHAANPWQQGGSTIGSALAAGPDLSKLSRDFSVPGVVIGVSGAPGLTPRQALAGDDFSSVCAPAEIQDVSEASATAAYQLWESCGGGTGLMLVMVIAPTGQPGLIGIVFQGTAPADLAFLDHIVGSIAPAATPAPSVPPPTVGPVSGPTYTISMDTCQNQHGQGVAAGLIRNDDALVHTYRIVVAFSDPNGTFLNDTDWKTSDLQPGVTATWQAMVPSGLPAVSVSCKVTAVELIR